MSSISYPPFSSSQHGWTLLPTLFCIIILLSIIRLSSLQSSANARIMRAMRYGEQHHEVVKRSVIAGITNRRRCSSVTVPLYTSSTMYEVCGEGLLPFSTLPSSFSLPPLLIDYDKIFSRSQSCPTPPTQTKIRLRDTPVARSDCTPSSIIQNDLIVLENLIGTSLTIGSASGMVSLLASPGAIQIDTLNISRDLVVVAGGDVRISNLQTESPQVKVTIISSLGKISVARLNGFISLLLAGRSTLEAPETVITPPMPLPPMRIPSIFGFRALSP